MENTIYTYLTNYLPKSEIDKLKIEMDNPLKYKGLLINPKKVSPFLLFEEFESLKEDPTNINFYTYIKDVDFPGRDILHTAGAYYILDRSSMLISKYLEPKNREIVLDMCAAPGGKTISYALKNPKALIVANDFSQKRAAELSGNVERLGIPNVIVTNFEPSYFLKDFREYFDKIILDAPCSGTGMFRKESKMKDDWSIEKMNNLLPLQDNLLDVAYMLLAKGGTLSYSTCSFMKEEDEDRVEVLLNKYKDINLVQLPLEEGYFEGTLKGTIHIFPHLYQGEGHFLAQLTKGGTTPALETIEKAQDFDKELNLYTFMYKLEKHALPFIVGSLTSLNALRMGLKITNTTKYAKCPFDHALSHYLDASKSIELTQEDATNYLAGQELVCKENLPDGFYTVSYKKVNLGYVNKKSTKLKNCYPKGLRIN
jgi:16S rRNA C967 or C1407 C5-methylase (RsmB/RsmF family)/NOL1/NOP2/fmu family ribosome biogenesis protein